MNHSKRQKKKVQRGRKLDLKGNSQHSRLSQKCSLPLLRRILYITPTPSSNLFLLCSIPLHPFLGLGPIIQKARKSIQRGRKLDLKGNSQHYRLSQKCSLPLLRSILYITPTPSSNLFLLCSIPFHPFLVLDPRRQRGSWMVNRTDRKSVVFTIP